MTRKPFAYEKESVVLRIDAKLMIPGRGDPIENGTVLVKEDKIIYAGSRKEVPAEYVSVTGASVNVVMPGMWDCHLHYLGLDSYKLDEAIFLPQALAGARATRDMAATLNSGFTSVREMAGYGADLSRAINEGWIPGPNVYSSVAAISQCGGHGDAHSIPLHVVQDAIAHGVPFAVCDGVGECVKAVRAQVRRGAKVIKICATGGVLSQIDSPDAPEFAPEELKAIVEEATRTDLLVAAHCHGKRGIMAALHAGVKTIEHGSYLDDEAIQLMLKKDAMLIATRSIIDFNLKNSQFLDENQLRKLREVSDSHKKAYAAAVKAGVKIALGTDLGVSSAKVPFRHGQSGGEFKFAVEAGMTELEAIEAGTANAVLTLGPRAPLSGQLKKGYDADIIVVSENPLEDIEILADPDKITHIWKGGKLQKSPGKPVGFFN